MSERVESIHRKKYDVKEKWSGRRERERE